MDVIYIGGAGRSGSTVLSQLLGAHENICAVGELTYFWERGVKENQLCSCGERFYACSFWSQVANHYFKRDNILDNDTIVKKRRELLMLRKTLNIESIIHKRKNDYDELLYHYQTLYEVISGVSGCPIVLDSSKYFNEFYLLKMSKILNVHLLHLIRDCRAVAYSWKNNPKLRPEIWWKTGYMPTYHVLQTTLAWLVFNRKFSKYSEERSYAKIQYENIGVLFSNKFAALQEKINLKLGVQKKTNSHIISGNPSRFDHKPLHFKYDRSHQIKQSTWDKRQISMLLYLAKKTGFYRH